jgi:hypothetical protein
VQRVSRAAPRLGGLVLVALIAGCSAGTSPVESCVAHALEEGVERGAAQAACEDAVGGE